MCAAMMPCLPYIRERASEHALPEKIAPVRAESFGNSTEFSGYVFVCLWMRANSSFFPECQGDLHLAVVLAARGVVTEFFEVKYLGNLFPLCYTVAPRWQV